MTAASTVYCSAAGTGRLTWTTSAPHGAMALRCARSAARSRLARAGGMTAPPCPVGWPRPFGSRRGPRRARTGSTCGPSEARRWPRMISAPPHSVGPGEQEPDRRRACHGCPRGARSAHEGPGGADEYPGRPAPATGCGSIVWCAPCGRCPIDLLAWSWRRRRPATRSRTTYAWAGTSRVTAGRRVGPGAGPPGWRWATSEPRDLLARLVAPVGCSPLAPPCRTTWCGSATRPPSLLRRPVRPVVVDLDNLDAYVLWPASWPRHLTGSSRSRLRATYRGLRDERRWRRAGAGDATGRGVVVCSDARPRRAERPTSGASNGYERRRTPDRPGPPSEDGPVLLWSGC